MIHTEAGSMFEIGDIVELKKNGFYGEVTGHRLQGKELRVYWENLSETWVPATAVRIYQDYDEVAESTKR